MYFEHVQTEEEVIEELKQAAGDPDSFNKQILLISLQLLSNLQWIRIERALNPERNSQD